MATQSAGLHENEEHLTEEVIDRHRAIVSLMEELEAVDWYDQRVAATHDAALAEILAHNRDEEMEHAAMNLEWLRRNSAGWDEPLRTYLFTEQRVVDIEDEDADDDTGHDDIADGTSVPRPASGDLGIGPLKGGVRRCEWARTICTATSRRSPTTDGMRSTRRARPTSDAGDASIALRSPDA